jgi:hypothetical protein
MELFVTVAQDQISAFGSVRDTETTCKALSGPGIPISRLFSIRMLQNDSKVGEFFADSGKKLKLSNGSPDICDREVSWGT